jgi:hypothetical protein
MNLSYEDLIIWFYDYKNCDDSLSEAKIIWEMLKEDEKDIPKLYNFLKLYAK